MKYKWYHRWSPQSFDLVSNYIITNDEVMFNIITYIHTYLHTHTKKEIKLNDSLFFLRNIFSIQYKIHILQFVL